MDCTRIIHTIALVVLTFTSHLECVIQDDTYEIIPGTKLNINLLSSTSVRSGIECVTECSEHVLCGAVNLGPIEHGERFCGLMQISPGDVGNMASVRGWTVMVAGGACALTPCLNGASCSIHGDFSFTCHCPPNYMGDLCQIPCYLINEGICYELTDSMPWHTAKDHCNSNGGRLVEIYDSVTNELLKPICRANWNTWIGLHANALSWNWYWDGSQQAITYDGWHTTEPNDWYSNERCAILWWDWGGNWADQGCGDNLRALCEYMI